MHAHFLQTFVEVCAGTAELQCKHALFADGLEVRCDNTHNAFGRLLLIMLHAAVQPVDIDFHRAVQNRRKL